jgi:DNA invertase Pin-like site-specific DNA recombinase
MIYGYAQLSTDGQSVDSQMEQLRAAGVEKIYREKRAGGARADRAQLRRVLAQLSKGDVLAVTRLDHLARSTRDLLNTLAAIIDKEAGFRSLGDTWADTTTAHTRLMLAVIRGLAEFDRALIRAPMSEDWKRAKARSLKPGRRRKLTERQRREAIKRRDEGVETLAEIGRSYNVSVATISRLTVSRTN